MADSYEQFKEKILRKTGINLTLYKEAQMKRRISSLASRNGFNDLLEYFKFIDNDKEKFNEFINFMTINVSEFFRNPEQWKIVETKLFPTFLSKNKDIKVWSAACSTGEEPYTITMILSTLLPLNKITVYATDIDDGAMAKAKAGVYIASSLKNVPTELKNKYFKKNSDGKFEISNEIKSRVQFKKHNLLKDPYIDKCDLIVCRNVMIYFTDDAKNEIYQKFSNSLKPDGVLFVGSTEQIISPQQFDLKSLKTFFYGRTNSNIKL
ncbi:CheR family methyltransferase [Peptoanaerobacter stomatis]|uniref:CheR family methyltransferase n=1 Tax=Peptoanaerobacter stomatis TaxID=796937 RepID=UPI003FA04216